MTYTGTLQMLILLDLALAALVLAAAWWLDSRAATRGRIAREAEDRRMAALEQRIAAQIASALQPRDMHIAAAAIADAAAAMRGIGAQFGVIGASEPD